MMKSYVAPCLLWLTALSFHTHAELNISGFASVNAGRVLGGSPPPSMPTESPRFLADYPMVSVYRDTWSMATESLLGVQASMLLANQWSLATQVVARGVDNYAAGVEWAYLSYPINAQWTLQMGRKHLPLFYYSEFYDIGYAYVWMRPPADNYTWQITSYNGVNLQYSGFAGEWMIDANMYAGREDDEKNRLLSEFFVNEKTKETWRDMKGLVVSGTHEWFEIRATAMTYTNERDVDGERVYWDQESSRDGLFYGVAANIDVTRFFVLTELSRLDLGREKFDTRMVTGGVKLAQWLPFVGHSALSSHGNQDGESHHTWFAGARWDMKPGAALKVQYDQVRDTSGASPVAGDSRALSLGLDVVF